VEHNEPPTQSARVRGDGNRIYQQVVNVSDERRTLRYAGVMPGGSWLPPLEHNARLDESARRQLSRTASSCLNWVVGAQNADGGLPTDDLGTNSCTWTTAGLLWAVACYGAVTRERWSRRAGGWLLAQLCEDGGLPTAHVGDTATTDATAQALMAAASYVTGDEDARLGRLAEWLLDSQDDSGAWSWMRWEVDPRTFSTGFALVALQAYVARRPSAMADVAPSLSSGVEWLATTQNPDGGWGDVPKTISRPCATGIAIFALSYWGGTSSHRTSGGDYLASTCDDGWPNGFERPSSHTIVRLGTPYAILGLTSTPDEVHYQSAQAAVPALLRDFDGGCFGLRNTRVRSWPTRDALLAMAALLRGCQT
jgi:prenyltransferase beta subunit